MDRPVCACRIFINDSPTRWILALVDHSPTIGTDKIDIGIRCLLIQVTIVQTLSNGTALATYTIDIANCWRIPIVEIITGKSLIEFSSRIIRSKITSFYIKTFTLIQKIGQCCLFRRNKYRIVASAAKPAKCDKDNIIRVKARW